MATQAAAKSAEEQRRSKLAPRDVPVEIWPVVVVLYATLLPREMRFYVGDLAFYADRVGLVLVLPWVVKKLINGAIRFVLPDIFVLIGGAWMIISMATHYGLIDGFKRGGSLALDATAGYYLARISFRSLNDVRRGLILFAPAVFLAGLSVMLESILHRSLIQPVAQRMFGPLPLFEGGMPTGETQEFMQTSRLGLMRGKGPFPHSILGGLYLSSLASLYLLSGLRGWPKTVGLFASILAFFSLSSAALLALLLSFGLSTYEWVQERVRELSWSLLMVCSLFAFVILDLTSRSGVISLISRYLTLDPTTAYYRQLTWQFGLDSVKAHALFGIGFAEYDRPTWMISGSIDAHWLLLAIRFGLPTALMYFSAVVVTLWALSRASVRAPRADRRFYRGIAIGLFVMALSMFTVTLWGGVQNWFTLLLGGCVACSQRNFKPIKLGL